jgi:hypothetical protein
MTLPAEWFFFLMNVCEMMTVTWRIILPTFWRAILQLFGELNCKLPFIRHFQTCLLQNNSPNFAI